MSGRKWIKLVPPVPLETTLGFAYAFYVLDQGTEHNLQWVLAINEGEHTGEFWCLDNAEVRLCKNYTLGRGYAKRLKRKKVKV